MALTDINFNEGEGRDFIVEIAAGSLNATVDNLVEGDSEALVLCEIAAGSSTGNVFILLE